MVSHTVSLRNQLGLHARAAARVIAMAERFEASIHFVCDDQRCSARDMMDVMLFGGWLGENGFPRFEIVAEGADEGAALGAMVVLIEERFGED